ncbi:hypothetical protein RRU94_04375 [Domibacillus sp. DTU_2020_1001157_1_SI_ALB_TIR_016]|uniref:hypothetical protein n=1 Tax=Domibacillus sp. DTU_2020_1001157_1_SI_ALB_TIR_016 TaxID=3077789 RepID=UPI0028EA8C02|nr:hypothetical protein [Domibacillus sp. DTU_2020_1001157_1_SI_ALB_TIR_016]WNS77749.1 hypothetical protein RRU94_04375 [Domibacillus sp. DTU_2020_1001157_1_SI_ALB_TIR_016]
MKQGMSIFLALSYIIMTFYQPVWLQWLVSFTVFTFILISIPSLKGMTAKLMGGLAALTILLLIGQEKWIDIIISGALVNLTIVAIFALTPILGIPFRTGGYIESLRSILYKKRNSASFFYISIAFLTHLLGAVINVGAISINYYLSSASNVKSNRLIANALNRGFAGAVAWSPYFAAMALVISQLHIKWTSIALYAIGFSLLSFLVGFFLEGKVIKREEERLSEIETGEEAVPIPSGTRHTLFELISLLFVTTGTVLLIEHFAFVNMIVSIGFTALFFPVIWCFFKGTMPLYKEEVKKHIMITLPNLNQEISLFLLAGLFSSAFVASEWSGMLVEAFSSVFGHSPVMMTIVLSIIIVGTAMGGLHPIVTVTILITSIQPSDLDFSIHYFAIALLGSWSISNVLSPATAVNNLIAYSLKEKLTNIAIRWNWIYGFIMVILLPFYLYFAGL